jgi:hypothetical protein
MNAPLKLSPRVQALSAAAPPDWTSGPWTEIFAATATEIQIAAIVSVSSNIPLLVDVGVGAAGDEAAVISARSTFTGTTGFCGNLVFWLPAPVVVPIGSRVSIRTYRLDANSNPHTYQLQYYTTADPTLTVELLATCYPYQENGKTLVSNAASFVNSDWCEITTGFDRDIGLYDLTYLAESAAGSRHEEWDIATGAEGEEDVITTLRSFRRSFNGERGGMRLPQVRPIPANTRIAVRLRSSEGVARSYAQIAINFYDYWETFVPEPPEPPEPPPPPYEFPPCVDWPLNEIVLGSGDGL